MTTLELYGIAEEKSHQSGIVNVLRRIVASLAGWRARRTTLLRLATLDAAQLSDIGIDFDDVQDALDGDGRRLWAAIATRNASR